MHSAMLVIILAALLTNVDSFNFNSFKNTILSQTQSASNSSISNQIDAFQFERLPVPKIIEDTSISKSIAALKLQCDQFQVPINGIINYNGNTSHLGDSRWTIDDSINFEDVSRKQLLETRYRLWRQAPWKKINGKFVLKAKIGGEFPLEPTQTGFRFGGSEDPEKVESLSECFDFFTFASRDPRVQAVLLDISRVACGYAKLTEIRRAMTYFRKSGKKIIGYCESGSEKEFYLALGCDEFYIPPDGGLDLRGFSGSATFVRGVFEKLGIEPQVQRIGKYKSFGDTFNRTSLSDAQREVISSLLMEASDFWVNQVTTNLNKSADEAVNLWRQEGVRKAQDWVDMGFVTGVRYLDQVENAVALTYRKNITSSPLQQLVLWLKSLIEEETTNTTIKTNPVQELIDRDIQSANTDFSLTDEFINHQRRGVDGQLYPLVEATATKKRRNATEDILEMRKNSLLGRYFPAKRYLKKLRLGHRIFSGLPLQETRRGERVAIINAVGGIGSGRSSNGPNGRSLGSESLIEMVRAADRDHRIKAVVLRVDSPGGSALASDLMWRELRVLSRKKPVVASMVDVAASGGYYLSMACDQIVAEDLTVTGSIGVVTAKFNLETLFNRIGYSVETLSRGRYAEVLSSSRGFTEDEDAYFAEGAQQAYRSFTTKAAASRDMTLDAMLEVAQGRVWTGRQARERGLVDHSGGLWKAVTLAASMAGMLPTTTASFDNITKVVPTKARKGATSIKVQTLRESRGGLQIPFLSRASAATGADAVTFERDVSGPLLICDESVSSLGFISLGTLGLSPLMQSLGMGPVMAYIIRRSVQGTALLQTISQVPSITSLIEGLLS